MAKNEHDLEGPTDGQSQLFKPDNATKLPTKHYPSSTKMATAGKKCSIEGPADCNKK